MKDNSTYRSISVIFYAIMTGHILFACVVVFILKPQPPENLDPDLYISLGAGMGTVAVMLGYWLYNQRVQAILKEVATEDEFIEAWKTPVIIRLALIEGACLFNLVLLLLTGNSLLLYFYVAAALAMLYAKPRPTDIPEF